ncbi:hypothetical protein HK101_008509 [Irineochytrium annulatum]|nr:hypothetical protein HK101_008509 [Irineochytrium annulatum]
MTYLTAAAVAVAVLASSRRAVAIPVPLNPAKVVQPILHQFTSLDTSAVAEPLPVTINAAIAVTVSAKAEVTASPLSALAIAAGSPVVGPNPTTVAFSLPETSASFDGSSSAFSFVGTLAAAHETASFTPDWFAFIDHVATNTASTNAAAVTAFVPLPATVDTVAPSSSADAAVAVVATPDFHPIPFAAAAPSAVTTTTIYAIPALVIPTASAPATATASASFNADAEAEIPPPTADGYLMDHQTTPYFGTLPDAISEVLAELEADIDNMEACSLSCVDESLNLGQPIAVTNVDERLLVAICEQGRAFVQPLMQCLTSHGCRANDTNLVSFIPFLCDSLHVPAISASNAATVTATATVQGAATADASVDASATVVEATPNIFAVAVSTAATATAAPVVALPLTTNDIASSTAASQFVASDFVAGLFSLRK